MKLWIGVLAAFLGTASPGVAQDQPALDEAARRAQEALESRGRGAEAYRRQERLRKDLRYMAEELDREFIGDLDRETEQADLARYAVGLSSRVAHLRAHGKLDARLDPTLDRLQRAYRDLPNHPGTAPYQRSLLKAMAEELRWAAETGKDEREVLAMLEEDLEDPFQAEALFPVDLPLARFKKLGPIRIFLVKHRIKRPASHKKTTAADLVAGRHNVQIGVELEGTVVWHGKAFDQDYTFNIGDLHLEVTPEWMLAHPGFPKPKKGDRVRIKGWTYFDSFHKAEEEYDPADPVLGTARVTLWEVHPVQEIELLPPPPPARKSR